jgi:hypothetical protein
VIGCPLRNAVLIELGKQSVRFFAHLGWIALFTFARAIPKMIKLRSSHPPLVFV